MKTDLISGRTFHRLGGRWSTALITRQLINVVRLAGKSPNRAQIERRSLWVFVPSGAGFSARPPVLSHPGATVGPCRVRNRRLLSVQLECCADSGTCCWHTLAVTAAYKLPTSSSLCANGTHLRPEIPGRPSASNPSVKLWGKRGASA